MAHEPTGLYYLSYRTRARPGDDEAEVRITAAILEGLREMLVGETEKDEAVLRVDGKVSEVEAAGGNTTTRVRFSRSRASPRRRASRCSRRRPTARSAR